MNNNESQHHGILGMKWGIRRYQNYDGTYTQAGVKRYRKAEQKYNSAKEAYASTRSKEHKLDMKAAKKEMEKHYKQLSVDKRADKGKNLYAKGERIEENNKKMIKAGLLTAGVVTAANLALENPKVSSSVVNFLGGRRQANNVIIAAGMAFTSALIGYEARKEKHNREIATYYGRKTAGRVR